MASFSVFTSYSSCCEEGRYCEFPERSLDLILREAGPILAEARSSYRETYGSGWDDEILLPALLHSNDPLIIRQARAAQQILFLGVIEWLTLRADVRLCCGFSLGYAAVFMAAKVFAPSVWLKHLHPANRRYANDNINVWNSKEAFTTLLCGQPDRLFLPYVKSLVLERYPAVVVKDERAPFLYQIVGKRDDLEKLRSTLFLRFPHAESSSTKVMRTDSAHLYPENYPDILRAFRSVVYSAPAFEVATHQVSLPSSKPISDGGLHLFNAIQGPLSMGCINAKIREAGSPVVFVGSARTARFSFYGFGPDMFPQPYFHWEKYITGDETPAELQLHQSTPVW